MKKIGKEVLFLSTGEKNPRNGEGSLLRLKDGRILVHIRVQGQGLFTVYQSESLDGGRSFSAPRPLLADQGGSPPHLLRLSDGTLISTYG